MLVFSISKMIQIQLTKEYLSILQYLLYKAQKQQKIKQVFKLQKICYKSKSLHLFTLRYKLLKNFEKKKIRNYLFEPIFKKLLQIAIFKKRFQINNNFLNSKWELNKNTANFLENWQYFEISIFFLDFIKKQIFSVNLGSIHWIIQLSYFSFCSNSVGFNIVPLINLQYIFLNEFYYSILLLLSTQNMLLFDIRIKKKYIHIKKNKIFLSLKFIPFIICSLFNYQLFYYFYFYHHNYFRDIKKIQYQNSFYFDLLSNKKYQFLFDNKSNKNKKIIQNFKKRKYGIFKNKSFCFYSIIWNFPYFRQNVCFFSDSSLNNLFFKSFTKKWFLERQLNHIQKQIFLLIFEPIWEASFEISSYSNRPGRSLFDAIEFLRLNLKKQPMFLFKIYLNFFYKTIYNYKEKKRNSKQFLNLNLQRKLNIIFINNKMEIAVSLFLCFFENIIFYGIQKSFQKYYLRIKQQIFLYQIFQIIKQNKKKNEYYFYKMFYNKIFVILVIQNQIQDKLENKKLINNYSIINITFNNYVKNSKQFIIDYCKNIRFSKYKNKMIKQSGIEQYNIFKKTRNIILKNYLTKNFLIFSLNNFFFEKIKNLKKRLFSIELNKKNLSFCFQKSISKFSSMDIERSELKIKGLSFSIIFKDSNFFVSKNTFLFFFIKKNKKLFLNLFNQWSNKKFCFFEKMKNSKTKKLQYKKLNNKNELIKIYLAQYNYKILLKINLYSMCYYFNSLISFLDFDSFYNIFLRFLLFIQNVFICSHLLNKKFLLNFYLIMYHCNFYGKFFSFFKYWFKNIFILFLLEKNDIQFIWNIFIKYKNQILVFNFNLLFLKNFEIILKKWIILNESFLFLYIYTENNINLPIKVLFNMLLYPALLIFNQNDWLIIYWKNFLSEIVFNNFYLKLSKPVVKNQIKKKILNQNSIFLKTLWAIKFFRTKQKHTFSFYKQNLSGFSFFDFFMFHTNKNNKKFISNYLFFWLLYFIQILQNFEYIKSFINYYQIYNFTNKKKWQNKQIKKILKLQLAQSNFLCSSSRRFLKYNNYIRQFPNLIFFNKNPFSSFRLFNLIFNNLLTNDYSFILYNKLIQQKKCAIYYYFSIKPSKYHIQKHLFQIYNIVKKNYNKSQEYIIFKLATIIKNWCFYYQIITPTILYKYLDYLTFQMLWRWACKRHYQKSKKWIKMKYFYKFNFVFKKLNNLKFHFVQSSQTGFYKSKKIVFASQKKSVTNWNLQSSKKKFLKNLFYNYKKNVAGSGFSKLNFKNINQNPIYKRIFICLPNHTDVILIKHKLIQNDRSPFDGDFIYWITRNCY